MNKSDYLDICYDLEKFHEVFSTLWKISEPRFTKDIPTAAVSFDPAGCCIDFNINPDYWNKCNPYTKRFIICHEMLHVILHHGVRSSPYRSKYTPDIINMALDLAVNHLLTSSFNFDRFNIDGWEKLCWSDTVLKDLDLDSNKSFEYYISKIKENADQINKGITVIDHNYLDSFDKNANDVIQKTINRLSNLTPEEAKKQQDKKENNLNNIPSGGRSDLDSSLFSLFVGQNLEVKKVKRWESVLNKYVFKSEKEREFIQWARPNRRWACLSYDILLPSENEVIDRDFYKYNIWLFLDYSGSCRHLKNMFFEASKTFDPRKFKVRKFAHTTAVAEFNKNECQVWGGGTSFSCIESFIQEEIKSGKIKKYPDAVFHFTDGEGNHFSPQHPERWYAFLTNNGVKYCYPKQVNLFKLSDFVKDYFEPRYY